VGDAQEVSDHWVVRVEPLYLVQPLHDPSVLLVLEVHNRLLDVLMSQEMVQPFRLHCPLNGFMVISHRLLELKNARNHIEILEVTGRQIEMGNVESLILRHFNCLLVAVYCRLEQPLLPHNIPQVVECAGELVVDPNRSFEIICGFLQVAPVEVSEA